MRNYLHGLWQPHNSRHLKRLDQHNRNANLHDNPLNAPLQRGRNPPPASQQRTRPPRQQLRPSNPHSADARPITTGDRPGTIRDKTARGAQVPRRGQPTQLEPRNIFIDRRVRHCDHIHEPRYLRVGTQTRVASQDTGRAAGGTRRRGVAPEPTDGCGVRAGDRVHLHVVDRVAAEMVGAGAGFRRGRGERGVHGGGG